MKQVYTLLFLVISLTGYSQTFEKTFHPSVFSIANDVSPNGSGGWYIAGFQANGCDYIINLDANGNVIWENDSYCFEVVFGREIYLLNNSDFIITGEANGCDFGGGPYTTRNDNFGNNIWQSSSLMTTSYVPYIGIVEKSNGQIASISYDGLIHRFDTSGQDVSYNPNETYTNLVGLSNDFSVAQPINSNDLQLLNVNDMAISTYSSFTPIEYLKSQNDTITYISNDQIYVLDNQLNIITTHNITNQFDEIIDYEYRADGYQILGKKSNIQHLKFFDNNDSLLFDLTFDNYREVNAISRQGDILAVTGNENSQKIDETVFMMESSTNIFIQTFDLNNVTVVNNDNDLEVLQVSADALHQQPYTCFVNGVQSKKVDWYNLKVQVKNNGTTTINDFELHGKKRQWCSYGCGSGAIAYKNISLQGLNLQPGDSTWITVGDWEILAQKDVQNNTICFWTTVPNQKIDDDFSNNMSCLTMLATNTNNLSNAQQFDIFPNPTSDILNVRFTESTTIEQIRLTNQIGQVIENQMINQFTNLYQLPIYHLPKGIYFMEIWIEGKRLVEKVMVE